MKTYLLFFLFILSSIGCHELPEPRIITYYILNDGSEPESFDYIDSKFNFEIRIKGYGFVFSKDEKGVSFSKIFVSLKNLKEDISIFSFEKLELESNYYQYYLLDSLKTIEITNAEPIEFSFLFRSVREDIKHIPIDEVFVLKSKVSINKNEINIPNVLLSPKKKI